MFTRLQRSLIQIQAVAAPLKTTLSEAPSGFAAWDSPSVKTVKKRDDLKKWV
jgi:hypothetical protein